MKILVTGVSGFIGKNLIAELKNQKFDNIFEYHRDTDPTLFEEYCKEAEFVFHLAGVNRPINESEFMEGNFGLTATLLKNLEKYNNNCPLMLSSSTQAELNNPYGRSKKAGEDLVFAYGQKTGAKVFVYRFPNVFGKWSRPNYNSVVATFCYNIAHDLPIVVNDPSTVLNLVYIDDVVEELNSALKGNGSYDGKFYTVPTVHTVTLGEIADTILSFKRIRENLSIPYMSDKLVKKLYSTYLSFLPQDQFGYPLKMNIDNRGSFTEIFRTSDRGQVSVNISNPGITKGNHWHHTKNEKFLVVSGRGVIRFRKIDSDKIIEYFVSGDKLEVVDIPPGYTHNIENLGNSEMATIMWSNECFDPDKPDTYYMEV